MTYRQAAYQILQSIKKDFADSDITIAQVVYWIQVTANKYKSIRLKKDMSGHYLHRFSAVPVKLDGIRKYIDIPVPILLLDGDAGINIISYNFDEGTCRRPGFTWHNFSRTTKKESNHLYNSKYQKPSPKNPFFYTERIFDEASQMWICRCFFLGIELQLITDVELSVFAAEDLYELKNIDQEIPVPAEWQYDLISSVLQLGRWILMVPEERKNDGEDGTQQASNYLPSSPQGAQAVSPQQAAQAAATYGSPE